MPPKHTAETQDSVFDSFLQVCDARAGGFLSPADVAQIGTGIGIKAAELINADAGWGRKKDVLSIKDNRLCPQTLNYWDTSSHCCPLGGGGKESAERKSRHQNLFRRLLMCHPEDHSQFNSPNDKITDSFSCAKWA